MNPHVQNKNQKMVNTLILSLQFFFFLISYLVGVGGSSTAWDGADPGATTAAVPIVTGKAPAEWTAPPWGSWDWTTGIGAIWII